MMHGGDRVTGALSARGVGTIFTLTGGHIAPILTSSAAQGIQVIDVRDEASAVFAADATSRLTGTPGVAVVTAGPGVTNGVTALQNALLARSPLVLIGGGAATALRGRGALQDIDQAAALRPYVKHVVKARRVRDISGAVDEAFGTAVSGVPGPVFVEIPLDLLYPEDVVRGLYRQAGESGLTGRYLRWHVDRLFSGVEEHAAVGHVEVPAPPRVPLERAAAMVKTAKRPVLVVGSGALALPMQADAIAAAVERLGVPTFLAGMARGLLGADHPLHCRHRRREALGEADLVVMAGMPVDFRLDYGRAINPAARVVTAGRDRRSLSMNLRPTVAVPGDAGQFLQKLASSTGDRGWDEWRGRLAGRDAERDAAIRRMADDPVEPINPLKLLLHIDEALADDSVIVADGGDFVASAAYTVRPRGPLRWLDPGVFGTLGVGAGFAMAATLARPGAEVWLLYGDGAAGFSIIEFDTLARHGLPVIAVVGNDAGWTQIARDQVAVLGDGTATTLATTDYHTVAEGLGAVGLLLNDSDRIDETLAEAKRIAATGRPVLVNAHIGKTDFRKGSLSM
jgi:thiamine pyrophosphate-dependent acetolactate synthase large subunit-like protein